MHETAVVLGLLGILDRKAEEAGIDRITAVRVVLGRLRGLDSRQLVGAFEVLAEGGRAEGARLEIVEVAPRLRCRHCATTWEAPDWRFACPTCGADDAEITAGRELYVESFDGARRDGGAPKHE